MAVGTAMLYMAEDEGILLVLLATEVALNCSRTRNSMRLEVASCFSVTIPLDVLLHFDVASAVLVFS